MLEIIKQVKETENNPTPDDWQRYSELRLKSKPTAKEVAEFKELLSKLKITPADAELHAVVLSEAERLKGLIKTQSKIETAEKAAFAKEQAARQKLFDIIFFTQRALQNNDFPESKEYNAARREIENIMAAKTNLGAIRSFFGPLFGLPADKKLVPNESYFGAAVRQKMAELQIRFANK